MKNIILGFLIALVVIGCAHAPVPKPSPGLLPQVFWTDQQARATEVSKIQGKLTLRFHSKKQNLSGQGRLVAQFPDRMRLEVRDPLGKVQYLVTMSSPSLVAYYPSQHTAYADEKSGNSYLKKFTGLNISFRDLQSIWLGLVPESLRKKPFSEWEWDSGRGAYRANLISPEYKLTCFVDPDLKALKEVWVESAAEPIKVTYGDFEPCCGGIGRVGSEHVPVGQTVNVVLEKSQTSVEVQWEEIIRLDGEKSAEIFQPKLPDGVQTIMLR